MTVNNFSRSSFIMLFLFYFAHNTVAQTYATPELQQQEEQHAKEKLARLGLTEEVKEVAVSEQKLPDLTQYLQVSGIDAVNAARNHSKDEAAKFSQEAKSEFKLNNFYLSLEKGKLIKINRQTGTFKSYDIVRTPFGFSLDCKTCNIPAFTIVEESASKVVCNQPSSDEGQVFEFRFTFER
jgi:hypothetical protein